MHWQDRLGLEPHPEGGWYRRIHSATQRVETPRGARLAASAIHYLLDAAQPRGRLHRVHAGILHFLQSGGPLQYVVIDGEGVVREITLSLRGGDAVFLEVPAGCWKGSRLIDAADHALVSEVVVPGFDWADHEYLQAGSLPPSTLDELRARGWLATDDSGAGSARK